MDYNDCIALIGAAEADDQAQRSLEADVYDLGPQVQIRLYGEKEAAEAIDFAAGIDDTYTAVRGVQQGAQGRSVSEAQVKAAAIGSRGVDIAIKEKEAVARELDTMLSAARSRLSSRAARKQQGLVLPGLSLPDQIGELERISAGIDGKSFTEAQIATIKVEVEGLRKAKAEPSEGFQKELAAMRDRRLAEVSSKLGL